MKIAEYIWLLLFVLWGLPLAYCRSRFRKTVYRTDDWKINFQLKFGKELKGLFGNLYPYDNQYVRTRNFYRLYLSVFLLLSLSHQVFSNDTNKKNVKMSKIEIGDKIPSFKLKNQDGNLINVDSIVGTKNLVIFFYPKDDSPGCTRQACSFRDHYEAFTEANAEVIGISGQSVKSHKKFAEKHNLSYTLLSDTDNQIRKQFGVPTNMFGLLPGRVTYVVNKSGEVMLTFNSQTNISRHVEEALKILSNSEN
jgi:peroxiredoxin Q/BCP